MTTRRTLLVSASVWCCLFALAVAAPKLVEALGPYETPTTPAPPPPAPKMQLVCYGAQGPLFPPLVVASTTLAVTPADEPFMVTFDNGMRMWVRGASCVAAELTADDLARLRAPPQTAPADPRTKK